MRVTKCENGHFFDASRHDRCPCCGAKEQGELKNSKLSNKKSKEEIIREAFTEETLSESFASGAVFDIARQQRERLKAIISSGNAGALLHWFLDAYSLFCSNPAVVGFPLAMENANKNDARIREMNADILPLSNGSNAALCYLPVQNEGIDARIIGIILSDVEDGFYYCMLEKDESVCSDVFRNKALRGIEKIGIVQGRGFALMNSFFQCIQEDFIDPVKHISNSVNDMASTEPLAESSQGSQDEKFAAILEAGMDTFAKSDHKDETAFKLIIAALINAPLYLPVAIDIEAMLGGADPAKLKPGDTLQPTKDVKMRILTLTLENNVEIIPMFTSNDEVNKGPSTSVIRFYPQDYLPKLVQMDKSVIINPFNENRFLLSKQLITEVLLPLVQNKTKSQTDVVEHPSDKYIGKIIDGKYEVFKLIGQGGFYTTYLVRNIHANKTWAMKVCDKKNQNYSQSIRANILTEPYMMKKLDHPAIPKVVDIIEDENGIFIVRDYIEGETLETIAKMYGAQPTDKVVEWGKQMCSALNYLHSQNPPLIYRDMKPANVILKPDGTIKFIDFGIMRSYKQNQLCDTCYLGTRGYAAPEQFGGSQTDARTDIFGLGMTMFRLVTGINPIEPPYEVKPICQVNPNLSKGLEYIISKCTRPNPNERYQSCDELLADLRNYQNLPPKKGLLASLFGKKK